jgi:hypothetical protein
MSCATGSGVASLCPPPGETLLIVEPLRMMIGASHTFPIQRRPDAHLPGFCCFDAVHMFFPGARTHAQSCALPLQRPPRACYELER